MRRLIKVSKKYPKKPKHPDIELFTDKQSIDECVNKVITYLKEKGFV